MSKFRKIILRDDKTKNGSVYLAAKIDEQQNLVLEGQDVGKFVEDFWGDRDYEYWLVINKEYKDSLLPWLIKDRFNTTSQFQERLKEKGIPNDFSSYV